jgi:hypothetical protein
MSSAKKVIDSTVKRVLIYTAEIIMSIVLLVIVCLPLAFAVPMWIQQIAFGVPGSNLAVDPIAWFGFTGATVVTALLAIAAALLASFYMQHVIGSDSSEES